MITMQAMQVPVWAVQGSQPPAAVPWACHRRKASRSRALPQIFQRDARLRDTKLAKCLSFMVVFLVSGYGTVYN